MKPLVMRLRSLRSRQFMPDSSVCARAVKVKGGETDRQREKSEKQIWIQAMRKKKKYMCHEFKKGEGGRERSEK